MRKRRYTLGEEIFSSVSHGVGTVLAAAATALLIVTAVLHSNVRGVVAGAIYGGTMVILYAMSTLYHSLTAPSAKKVFRVIDHCSIFLLIAGTYTPICLCALYGRGGLAILSVIWAVAIGGIVLNAVNLEKFKNMSVVLYVLMGVAVVFKVKELLTLLDHNAVILLIVGGVVYLVGLIFYLMKNVKFMHSIWHIFVLGGSVLHFLFILLYVI